MRIDLGKLSLADLLLDLAREGHPEDQILLRAAEGVTGSMIQNTEGMELKKVAAERVLLDLLRLTFGTFMLNAQGAANFQKLTAELATRGGELTGRVGSEITGAAQLVITVGKLRITGRLEAEQLALDLKGSAGEVRAEKATFRGLEVQAGALSISCPMLSVEGLSIGWGENPSFTLSCRKAVTAELQLTSAGIKAKADDIALLGVDVRGGNVAAASARLARIEADATFVRSNKVEARPRARERKEAIEPALKKEADGKLPLYDDALLDGLSGRINADVEVDIAVPIIGGRHAIHELRLPVQEGSIDYLTLEGGLSRLEDALLNFAARDGKLVLELGFPLVGQRGHGKPLVVWDLTPEDYRLAENNRVRLAVLPHPRSPNAPAVEPPKAEPEPEPKEDEASSSRFALRSLSVGNVDTELSLSPRVARTPENELAPGPMNASLQELSFGQLRVQGTVHHDVEARGLTSEQEGDDGKLPNRDGSLRVDLQGLAVKLHEFAMEENELSLTARLENADDIKLRFEDIHLAQVTGVLSSLALENLRFGTDS